MLKLSAVLAVSVVAMQIPASAGVFYNNPQFNQAHRREVMKRAWLVRVKPGRNAYFYNNAVRPNCPAAARACKRRGYLLPGDIAVAAYSTGAFTVVDYVSPQGTMADGAIESRLLEKIGLSPPKLQDWVGNWQSMTEQSIEISRTASVAVLAFRGDASYGADDPERVKRGGVNLGSLAAYVKPVSEWGGFIAELDYGYLDPERKLPPIATQKGLNTDWSRIFLENTPLFECRASFRLLGPYILAYTPVDACGGNNVTFTGVYRHVRQRT